MVSSLHKDSSCSKVLVPQYPQLGNSLVPYNVPSGHDTMSQASSAGDKTSGKTPTLNIALHTRYWLRCLKTFLPTGYQEQDSSRLVLAFFILTSLDLLGGLETHTTPAERADYVSFIYSCQHPGGGFRSFPGTDFGLQHATTPENARWDPASVAGTYFALGALAILGDDLSRVRRQETLDWIRNLQHPDGSFGDLAAGGKNATVDGGQDVRFCFLAVLVCAIVGEEQSASEAVGKCVDVDRLKQFILDSQTYDGGIARKPNCESHAGSTYCAISVLKLLDLLPTDAIPSLAENTNQVSPTSLQNLLHWLSHRQTTMLYDYRDTDIFDEEDDEEDHTSDTPGFAVINATPALPPSLLAFERMDLYSCDRPITAGLNGRVNKPADTCYSFWAGATLAVSAIWTSCN